MRARRWCAQGRRGRRPEIGGDARGEASAAEAGSKAGSARACGLRRRLAQSCKALSSPGNLRWTARCFRARTAGSRPRGRLACRRTWRRTTAPTCSPCGDRLRNPVVRTGSPDVHGVERNLPGVAAETEVVRGVVRSPEFSLIARPSLCELARRLEVPSGARPGSGRARAPAPGHAGRDARLEAALPPAGMLTMVLGEPSGARFAGLLRTGFSTRALLSAGAASRRPR